MSNNSNQVSGSPGGRVTSIQDIEKLITVDVGSALLLLKAIQEDVNLKRMVATYIHGNFQNRKHADERVKVEQEKSIAD